MLTSSWISLCRALLLQPLEGGASDGSSSASDFANCSARSARAVADESALSGGSEGNAASSICATRWSDAGTPSMSLPDVATSAAGRNSAAPRASTKQGWRHTGVESSADDEKGRAALFFSSAVLRPHAPRAQLMSAPADSFTPKPFDLTDFLKNS